MTISTPAKDYDLRLWSGYSRTRCEQEFGRARNCTRSWSLRQLRKKHPKNLTINNMNAASIHSPSWPSRENNVKLKLGLWNVRSIGKDDKLLSILGDALARRLNVLVLTETRHSEKVCLKLDGGHTLYNSGPTDEQRNIGGVGFLVCAGEKPAPSVVQFEGRSERVATLLLDYNGTRIGICAAYSPTEASQSDSNKEAFYKELTDAYSSLKRKCKVALVLGDFNCRLGRDARRLAGKIVGAGGSDGVATTENGLRVLAFCKANGLRIWNTWFNRSKVRRHTWYHPATKRERC